MRNLRLPLETEPHSIIYRLRAGDGNERDYPLTFAVEGSIGNNLIYIKERPCTRSNNIYCDANVYLRRPLESGRVYTFRLTVSDTQGDQTDVTAMIETTAGKLDDSQIFLKFSQTVEVDEDMAKDSEITTVMIRKHPLNIVNFDIMGDEVDLFRIKPKLASTDVMSGTVVLDGGLDYEKTNLHVLRICALNPYTDESVDTRNIVCVTVSVVVTDKQDEPPVFIHPPPVTRISPNKIPGDVLVKLEAEDGDKGDPRTIRFDMRPSSSVFTNSFDIDPVEGTIVLEETMTKVIDKMVTLEPILLTVTAEEVTHAVSRYPALSTEIEIAFVVMDSDLLIPKFIYEQYVGEVRENSPIDSPVYFSEPFLTRGVKGVFSLSLEDDDGAFAVQPSIVRDSTDFIISVKNSALLDYEKRQKISFKLIAKQVSGGSSTASSSVEIVVRILDANDNSPKFSQEIYREEIYENITAGTSIIKVSATDVDSGEYGTVRYTRLSGPLSDRLVLDPITGLITCATNNHDFDRETSPEYQLTVEARDDAGNGNTATARLRLRIKDVNDSPPRFLEPIYKGVMSPDMQRLKSAVKVQAIDDDAEEPNNQVVYSIERSFYSDHFHINRITGELDVSHSIPFPQVAGMRERRKRAANEDEDSVIELTVKASDLGSPSLSHRVPVQIYTQEYVERFVKFIYPRSAIEVRANKAEIERMLSTLTGGPTEIKQVADYRSGLLDSRIARDKSVVTALVRHRANTVVDLEKLSRELNSTQPALLEQNQVVQVLKNKNASYLTWVVLLCVILAIIIIVLILCCLCPGCPLYRNRKKTSLAGDENEERVSYIRTEERGANGENKRFQVTWWNYLPSICTDTLISCGCHPPAAPQGSSRLAWSGNERQRNWRFGQGGGPPGNQSVNEEQVMARGRNHRDAVLLEDFDDGKMQHGGSFRQNQMVKGDPRAPHQGLEPRRVFVLRDTRGQAAGADSLREGDTYLIEDIDSSMRRQEPWPEQGQFGHGADENAYYARQGNVEVLRLHSSPPGAGHFDDRGHIYRSVNGRAGMEPGGIPYSDYGGSTSSRSVEGQSYRSMRKNESDTLYDDGRGFVNNAIRYISDTSPPHSDADVQTDVTGAQGGTVVPRLRFRTPIEEETASLLEAEAARSYRERPRPQVHHHRHVGSYVQREREEVSNRSKSSRSYRYVRPPTVSGYQHTKASLLRYESNKAKLEEDALRDAEAAKRYSLSDGNLNLSTEGNKRRSLANANLSYRRHYSYGSSEFDADGYPREGRLIRQGSLPELETNLEREAARRSYERRSSFSSGDQDYDYQEDYLKSDNQRGGPQDERQGRLPRPHQQQSVEDRYVEGDSDRPKVAESSGQGRNRQEDILQVDSGLGSSTNGGRHMEAAEAMYVLREAQDMSERERKQGVSEAEASLLRIQAQNGDHQNVVQDPTTTGNEATNLPDDAKTMGNEEEGVDMKANAREEDISALAAERGKRNRNSIMEKKSIFSRVYDGMETKKLRPESAATDP